MSRQAEIDNQWRFLRKLYDAFGFPHEYHDPTPPPRRSRMRNLRQYPITRTEKLLAIDEMIEKAEKELRAPDAPVGGVELVILHEIKKDVEFATDEHNQREHGGTDERRYRTPVSDFDRIMSKLDAL